MESVKIMVNLMFHIPDQIEKDDNIVFKFSFQYVTPAKSMGEILLYHKSELMTPKINYTLDDC